VCVEDCDLGQQTVIHAVQVIHKDAVVQQIPLNEDLVDLQVTGSARSEAGSVKAHFFVYCKSCWPRLQTGKIRVRLVLMYRKLSLSINDNFAILLSLFVAKIIDN
jgi:hypothetical protein